MHGSSVPVTAESAVPQPRLPPVCQVANELNISMRSVWRLLATGELKAVRLGRATRVTRDSIEEFIARGGSR